MRDWHVRFSPGPDLMRSGANPLLLLRELKQLGSLWLQASMAAIPPLAELDPERCYIAWDMVLTTAAAREAICDVFIFVADSCELSIEPVCEVPVGPPVEKRIEPAQGQVSSDAASLAAAAVECSGEEIPALGTPRLRYARQRVEYSRPGHQTGSVRQPGGRIGYGASATG